LQATAAGIVIGLVGAVRIRAHPLWASLLGGMIAAGFATAAIVFLQWRGGRWPVGTIDGRMIFTAIALAILVCSTGLLTALATSLSYRRTS
jgi:hypothetical protein